MFHHLQPAWRWIFDHPRTAFLGAWLLHTLLMAFVLAPLLVKFPTDGTFGHFGFHMDGIVRSLLFYGGEYKTEERGIEFRAPRMPLIPWFLAAGRGTFGAQYPILATKLFLTGGLLWWSFWMLWKSGRVRPGRLLAGCAFILAFPQLLNQQLSLATEESYLIGLLAAGTAAVLVPEARRSLPERLLLLLLPAILYLLKSSLLPVVAGLLVIQFWLVPRRWAIGAAALAGAALLGWALHVQSTGGGLRLGTSLDGWNLHKGNNRYTALYYPLGNLDDLSRAELLPEPPPGTPEWEAADQEAAAAKAWIGENPGHFAALTGAKGYILLLDVVVGRLGNNLLSPRELVGLAFFAAFRVLWVLLMLEAARRLWRGRRNWKAARLPLVIVSAFAAYSAPFILGFAYHRHALPLIAPTVFLLLWWKGGHARTVRQEPAQ